MATRWLFIPPGDYLYSASGWGTGGQGVSAVGVYPSGTQLLINGQRTSGASDLSWLLVPLYNTVSPGGRFYSDPVAGVINKVHFFHSLSGVTSAGMGPALVSAWATVVEYNLSAGLNISGATVSATRGVQAQLPNTNSSANFVSTVEASGTAWGNTGPNTLANIGTVPSALPQVIQEDIFTAPSVYTGQSTASDGPALSASRLQNYVPRLYPTYQALVISANLGLSATWVHYGTIVEYV